MTKLNKKRIGITLSGGGHRATLFGLGALLAIVDSGANVRVEQISSVSGGSITNAFIASRCKFEAETSDSFDEIARELIEAVIYKGVLTKSRLLTILITILCPPVAFVVLAILGALPSPLITITLVGVWIALILCRGMLIEALLSKCYFGKFRSLHSLGELNSGNVEHVFCSTDLAMGVPCYFSTWNGGYLHIRLSTTDEHISGRRISTPNMLLAGIVRASAAFPGIPPRRVSLRKFRQKEEVRFSFGGSIMEVMKPLKDTLYLSDGGVWNNLGTQALIEDRVFKEGDDCRSVKPEIGIVVNASAQLSSSPSWKFIVPGYAELATLLRIVRIVNENTVSPRLENLRTSFRQWIQHETVTTHSSSIRLPIIVDINRNADIGEFYRRTSIALLNSVRDPSKYRIWASDLADYVAKYTYDRECGSIETNDTEFVRKLIGLSNQMPDTYSVKVEIKHMESLETLPAYQRLCEMSKDLEEVPTSLDKISQETAKSLIARAYAQTLASLYVFRVIGQNTDVFSKLSVSRLHRLTSRREL